VCEPGENYLDPRWTKRSRFNEILHHWLRKEWNARNATPHAQMSLLDENVRGGGEFAGEDLLL
jgi:hypothetical protein